MANKTSFDFGAKFNTMKQMNSRPEEGRGVIMEAIQHDIQDNTPRKSPGRPSKIDKLTRDNCKATTVFVDKDTEYKLGDIKNYDKIDIKDVMLVATIEFLDRYFSGRQLTTAGKELVEKRIAEVISRTKIQ